MKRQSPFPSKAATDGSFRANKCCENYYVASDRSRRREEFLSGQDVRNDPFNLGLPVYTFERKCQENAKANLNDASHDVIFNSSAWQDENDSDLRAFLSFVQGNSAKSGFTRRIAEMVKQKKFEQTFINEYMAWNLHDSDVKKQGIKEGISRGAAQQKVEDDKLIAQITAQKDAEIARLKACLRKNNLALKNHRKNSHFN